MGSRKEWHDRVMKIYKAEHAKNKNYKLGDAMKSAKKGWK